MRDSNLSNRTDMNTRQDGQNETTGPEVHGPDDSGPGATRREAHTNTEKLREENRRLQEALAISEAGRERLLGELMEMLGQARTHREEILRLREMVSREKARRAQEEAARVHSEVDMLEGLLDAAYTQLRERGITEPLEFVITRKAIDLAERLPDRFTFDTAYERYVELEQERVDHLLQQLLKSGVLRQKGSKFEKTGERPYF